MVAAALLALLFPQAEPQDRGDDYRAPGYVYAQLPNPWGRSGWEVGGFAVRPVGFFLQAGVFGGSDLDLHVPLAINISSDGVNPPLRTQFEYDRMSFLAAGVGGSADLDGLRLSLFLFSGDFEADGSLTVDDSVGPVQRSRQDVEGDMNGFRVSGFWPAIRYRSQVFEGSLGPALGVGWIHTEIDNVPGSPLTLEDVTDQVIVTLGPKLSLRGLWGRVSASLEAEYSVVTGDARGAVFEATLGLGLAF